MKRGWAGGGDGSFALVSTLMIIAVMAVGAMAFFQAARMDRVVSRNTADLVRAQLAAESGLAAAGAQLRAGTVNDHFLIVANTNRHLFAGNGQGQSGSNIAYQPLFSCAPSVEALTGQDMLVVTPAMPTMGVPNPVQFTNRMPGGLRETSPPVTWVPVLNEAGQTNARFAYWVEDLAGRLDVAVAGSNGEEISRPTGMNPAELALWSLFNPSAALDSNNVPAQTIVGSRPSLLTPASIRLVLPDEDPELVRDLGTGLVQDTNEPEVIPYGLGYPDAGRPKYDLNTNLSSAGVTNLANIIQLNLPNFGQRGGGMAADPYVRNIAASIVDYADADSTPTVDDDSNPTYLGIENLPWPNEIFHRLRFLGVDTSGRFQVELKDWIEVWNMGNKPVEANSDLSTSNNIDMVVTFTNTLTPQNSVKLNLRSFINNETITNRVFNQPNTIPPNSYAVLEAANPSSIFLLSPPGAGSFQDNDSWFLFADQNDATTNASFSAKFQGKVIQRTISGRWTRFLAPSARIDQYGQARYIFCNNLGYASQTSINGVPAHVGGDPRIQLFLSGALYNQNYTNRYATPGGRNRTLFQVARFPESEVRPGDYWPDLGHQDSIDLGPDPLDSNETPSQAASRVRGYNITNWVMIRNDTGTFSNAVELGNIFDALQWRDQSSSAFANQPGLWMGLSAGATADTRFGGRNTLRIGRPEFPRFNSNGIRAVQLLDLFAGSTNAGGPGGTVRPGIAGRINLNTASTNALRALAAGVAQVKDLALKPDGTNFVVPAAAVDAFVAAATNFRSRQPFISPAQLGILSNPAITTYPSNAIFGNTNLLGVTEWNDAAAEEWFSKVYPLATVRSRNFLVHVVGQAMRTNAQVASRPVASIRRVYQIYMTPQRDSGTGMATNSTMQIVRTWSLP